MADLSWFDKSDNLWHCFFLEIEIVELSGTVRFLIDQDLYFSSNVAH